MFTLVLVGAMSLSLPGWPNRCRWMCGTQQSGWCAPHLSALLQATQQGLQEVVAFDTTDGLYDCAWSEVSSAPTCATSGCRGTRLAGAPHQTAA